MPDTPRDWQTVGALTTSDGEAGAAHFEPPAPLILRAQTADGSQLLMSECMTMTMK